MDGQGLAPTSQASGDEQATAFELSLLGGENGNLELALDLHAEPFGSEVALEIDQNMKISQLIGDLRQLGKRVAAFDVDATNFGKRRRQQTQGWLSAKPGDLDWHAEPAQQIDTGRGENHISDAATAIDANAKDRHVRSLGQQRGFPRIFGI